MAGIEKKRLQDILLPWSRVVYTNKNDSIEKITHIVLQSGHTRLPICEDHKVIGLLHTKEFIALKESGEKDWQKIIRPALYMYAHDSALSAIRRIQNQRTHLAIVLDTQGRKVGIVTLEDIIEEVVGDFFDEDDDGRVRQIYAIKSRNRTALKE